jgi:predicted RNA binding protein YcfA (HicA-like mRNA interferase family)
VGRRLNQKSAAKLLRKHGWVQAAGGKHGVKMTHPGRRPITLPKRRGQDYTLALTRAILRQARIDPEEL